MRFILLCALALAPLSVMPAAQTMGSPERFSAFAVNTNTGDSGRVEISVTRWSTPAERETLVQTLVKEGQDALLKKLRDMRETGRIYTPGSIGYELRYAEQFPQPEGGRRIILATDRPMSFWELINRPRSSEYPFTWVELNMKADGTGEGQLAVRARAYGEPKRPIEVETFDIQPIRLQKVTSERNTN